MSLGCHGDGRVDVTDLVSVLRLGAGIAEPPTSPPCRLVSRVDGAEMVLVPTGAFLMGSDTGRSDERPVHRVELDAYYIDVHEVTNEQYARFIAATGYLSEGGWRTFEPDRARHPVVDVTWNDAVAYTFWVGRRLPTEAEWEKASRGTDSRTWPWGEEFFPDRFNYGLDVRDTVPVGSYPNGASPYGALDMSGNICEWLSDWYDPGYYRVSPLRNPRGPKTGRTRSVRGGSWAANAVYGMTMVRTKDPPHTYGPSIGFRCALSLHPENDS
jgi:iron(II)-dependent oxidoreductase